MFRLISSAFRRAMAVEEVRQFDEKGGEKTMILRTICVTKSLPKYIETLEGIIVIII
jgi:hypothetical protein